MKKHFVPDWYNEAIKKQIIARNLRNGSGVAVRYLASLAEKKGTTIQEFNYDDICHLVRTVLDEHKAKFGWDSVSPVAYKKRKRNENKTNL